MKSTKVTQQQVTRAYADADSGHRMTLKEYQLHTNPTFAPNLAFQEGFPPNPRMTEGPSPKPESHAWLLAPFVPMSVLVGGHMCIYVGHLGLLSSSWLVRIVSLSTAPEPFCCPRSL